MTVDDVWQHCQETWAKLVGRKQYEYQYETERSFDFVVMISHPLPSELSDHSVPKQSHRCSSSKTVRGNLRGSTLRGAIAACCGLAFLVSGHGPASSKAT